jgi:hypothetical protein
LEAVVALTGGILLLLSFSGGSIESRIVSIPAALPTGDRVAAAVVGWALIALAAMIEVESLSEPALWVALGLGTGAIVAYAFFLVRTRPR